MIKLYDLNREWDRSEDRDYPVPPLDRKIVTIENCERKSALFGYAIYHTILILFSTFLKNKTYSFRNRIKLVPFRNLNWPNPFYDLTKAFESCFSNPMQHIHAYPNWENWVSFNFGIWTQMSHLSSENLSPSWDDATKWNENCDI